MVLRRLKISLIGCVLVAVVGLSANLIAGNSPSLGLDLQGGASVTLEPKGEYDSVALDVAVEIIRSRVDSIGVAEPEIIRQGATVVVNLPGVKDQQRALEIVGRTGEVLLRPVLQSGVRNTDTASTTTIPGQTIVPGQTTVPGATTVPVTTVAGATSLPAATTSVPTASTTASTTPVESGGVGSTRRPVKTATSVPETSVPETTLAGTTVPEAVPAK